MRGLGLAVLAVACCGGLPLLLAAGAGAGAAAAIGGVAAGAVALTAAGLLIVLRLRRSTPGRTNPGGQRERQAGA